MANERTFLSWLRTAVSLMAFGFVVSKFNLFIHLHIQHLTTNHLSSETYLGLAWVGAGMVVIGVATVHFYVTRRRIYEGRVLPMSRLPLALSGVLGILGILVFLYLLNVH
ncbi:MAG: DUF202 domain-containing protein [Firmicutes bacterium]|nr:DUF202 domain-containing protein [Bacillota bacterium]